MLSRVLALLLIAAAAVGTVGAGSDPQESFEKYSPDGAFIAAGRRIPDPKYVWKESLDGTRIVILNGKEDGPLDQLYAAHNLAGRVIEKAVWTSDSRFLVFSTSSPGGHSPWHFNTYVFCVADKSFRDLESGAGGLVTDANFAFEEPNTVVLTVQDPSADGGGAPKTVKIQLSEKCEKLKAL